MDEGSLLKIYVGEGDRRDGRPLHQWIVDTAHARGLAGATVLRAIEGFGAASRVHTTRVLRLSTDLPLVVEIVDTPERIEAFVAELAPVLEGGTLTVAPVRMRLVGGRPGR